MANNDSATPITTGTVTGKPKERGIYYFKLGSEYFLYDEDEQRLCGLTGAEIDSNFHFLSGYDIKNVEINYSAGTVVITRVNDEFEPIVLDLTEVRPEYSYDPETGKLTVTYPDGEEKEVEGFFVDEGKYDLKVYTDGTLDGIGDVYSPLSLSRLERTGFFAPVETLVEDGDIEAYKGRRILTKELIDDYGHLYSYDEVEAIQSALTKQQSPWRVATKQDWDELLNAMEQEEGDRNHGDCDVDRREEFHGFGAGDMLKSTKHWRMDGGIYTDENEHEYVGFGVLPVGVRPYRANLITDEENDIEGFGELSAFWAIRSSADTCPDGDPFVKIFSKGFGGVAQKRPDEDDAYSVRLVKECEPGCPEQYETILGSSYPVGPITSPCGVEYCKIWTLSNLYSKGNGFSGLTISGTNVPPQTEYAYFITECDGRKKRLMEGESVVILDRDKHEHRVIDGILVDIDQRVEDIEKAVNELSSNTVTAMNVLDNRITEQVSSLSSATRTEIDNLASDIEGDINAVTNDLNNKIDALSSATEESISAMATELSGAIESSISSLSAATEDAITNESARAIAAEESLGNEISELSGNTDSEINRVDERINSFSANTEAALNNLGDKIDNEINALSANTEAAINETQNTIDALSSATENFKESTLSELDRIGEDFERMVANTGGVADRVTAIEGQIPSINEDIEEVSNKVDDLSGATSEIVATIDETLDEISSTIPVDVVYSKPILKNSSLLGASNIPTTGRIQLRLADGTYSDGFDASDFLIDSVLTNVEFNDADKTITFIWNDQFSSRQIIPLSALSHVYGVSPESVTYLRLDGNDFHPIVDGEGGFVKTLASTEFAENAAAQAASAAVAPIRTYIDILKGGDGQVGSVSHLISDKFITDGLPVGQIDANQHSLLRAVDVNGELKYFVSAKAEDMYYTKPDGTNVILGNYITSLENRVAELESGLTAMSQRVASLESVGIDEAGVRQIIKNYLEGTEQEIKITENGDKLKVGFADDAVFGFITQ